MSSEPTREEVIDNLRSSSGRVGSLVDLRINAIDMILRDGDRIAKLESEVERLKKYERWFNNADIEGEL